MAFAAHSEPPSPKEPQVMYKFYSGIVRKRNVSASIAGG